MRFVAGLIVIASFGVVEAAPSTSGPCAVVMVVDRALPKLDEVKRGLIDAASSLDATDRFALVAFDGNAQVLVPLQSARASAAGVKRLAGGGDGWNMLAGIEQAGKLLAGARESCKRIVVVTNGSAVIGVRALAEKLTGITISAVGVASTNRVTLDTIASAGRGKSYVIDDGKALAKIAMREAKRGALRGPDTAVVFCIDRTMAGASHDLAKDVARIGLEGLESDDFAAVVVFDREAAVFVRPQRVANRMRMSAEISRLTSTVGGNVYPALVEAQSILDGINADAKHVIVISDGLWAMDGVTDLVDTMRARSIMVSAVGVPDADRVPLGAIADHGDGRLFMIDKNNPVPPVFKLH